MKYSYNWLQELSKTKKNSEELAKMIGLRGFEFEGAENLAGRWENFVVGEIEAIEEHPNADKLRVARVKVGASSDASEPLQIVCGALNIKVGQKVPVALVGATVPKFNLKITKSKIRGVESQGMLCSEDELGLGKDAAGIMILNSKLKVGQSLTEALGLMDTVVEFDILPNRAHDCLSYQGMVREIATMEGRKFELGDPKSAADFEKFKGGSLKVTIENKQKCPRYLGGVLTGAKIKPSPGWMQNRLIASGLEPINNVVDITNFVMLEVGSPLHAFDWEKLVDPKTGKVEIKVRDAQEREGLELLDGTILELTNDDLVIADSQKPLALAGIKGGLHSGINLKTNKLVLEAANFSGFYIRKTRQRHKLLTQSQHRFEKEISPVLAERAFWRAVELLEKYADAKLEETARADYYKPKTQELIFDFIRCEKLLGRSVDPKKVEQIFTNLGFEKVEKGSKVEISPPSPLSKGGTQGQGNPSNLSSKEAIQREMVWRVPFWRLDIEGEADLYEEIGRIEGYEKIEPRALPTKVEAPRRNQLREFEWQARDNLAALGLNEMMNYSFYSREDQAIWRVSGEHWELENPLSQEGTLLRKTLLPGLIKNIALNSKNLERISLFEIGKVFPVSLNNSKDLNKRQEAVLVAGALFDRNLKEEAIFHQLKGKLESFLEGGLKGKLEWQEVPDKIAGVSLLEAKINLQFSAKKLSESLGRVVVVDPKLAQNYGIKTGRMVFFELDLGKLFFSQKGVAIFRPLDKFPGVLRDISLYIDPLTSLVQVTRIIESEGEEFLKNWELFDTYFDPQTKRKSLALRLELAHPERTLEGAEAEGLMKRIIQRLEKKGFQVRKSES